MGFPQYGLKAGLSDSAFPVDAYARRSALRLPFVHSAFVSLPLYVGNERA